MSKVIQFSTDKRHQIKALEEFKNYVNSLTADEIKGAVFYLEKDDRLTADMAVYAPTYELTGRLREFLNEINLELYVGEYLGLDETDKSE